MSNHYGDEVITVTPKMELAVEVQSDVVPFLRDNRYPASKLVDLERMLEVVFETERTRGRGPKKGCGGRPKKGLIAS